MEIRNSKHLNIIVIAIVFIVALAIVRFALNTRISISPSVSPSVSTAPSWQTYKSEEFGFEVQYPEGWFYDDKCGDFGSRIIAFGLEQNMIVCYSDAPSGGPVTLGVGPKSQDMAQIIESTKAGLFEAQESTITVGGQSAIKISGVIRPHEGPGPEAGLPLIMIMFDRGSLAYRFTYIPVDEKNHEAVFNRIVSSMKFSSAPAVDTSNWRTFTSQHFGISFKYPDGYEVSEDQNALFVAKGKFEMDEGGTDNAFLRIIKYTTTDIGYTREEAMSTTGLRGASRYKVTIDGIEFDRIDGIYNGVIEGVNPGKISRVIFSRSALTLQQYDIFNQDNFLIGDAIISSIRFTQ